RADHGTLGLVGIIIGDNKREKENELNLLKLYLQKSTEDLVSTLVEMVNDLEKLGDEDDLGDLIYVDSRWSQFLQYLAHMYNQSKELGSFNANAELFLRKTYGFNSIEPNKRRVLLNQVKKYAEKLDKNKDVSTLSDSTGIEPDDDGNEV